MCIWGYFKVRWRSLLPVSESIFTRAKGSAIIRLGDSAPPSRLGVAHRIDTDTNCQEALTYLVGFSANQAALRYAFDAGGSTKPWILQHQGLMIRLSGKYWFQEQALLDSAPWRRLRAEILLLYLLLWIDIAQESSKTE